MSDVIQESMPECVAGMRLDQALAELYPEYSRSRLQSWIKQGRVRLDGECCKTKRRLWVGERLWMRPSLRPCYGVA